MMLKPSIDPPTSSSAHKSALHFTTNALPGIKSSKPAPAPAVGAPEKTLKYNVPTVVLEQDRVTDTMAAGLAMSLLGHVLFLKGQVPFPVIQMSKMPVQQIDTRAFKKRQELLSSLDTLTSHLQTTFSALSNDIAKRSSKHDFDFLSEGPYRNTEQVYMMVVLGPSVNAGKARVVLVIDGLEIKLWGGRDDLHQSGPDTEDAISDEDDDESEEDDSDGDSEASKDEDRDTEDASDCEDLESECEEESDSDSATEPPLSRSPSPDVAASSSPSSPQPDKIVPLGESPKSRSSPSAKTPTLHTPHPREQSYAAEQEQLRSAERLLSRTLANACAEDGGIASEITPTEAHILLRAPRRFAHPAWTPKQMWTPSLDTVLSDFLDASGIKAKEPGANEKKNKAATRGIKTEGVYVGCKASAFSERRPEIGPDDIQHEEDEMIWWSWNGKVVGFSDW